MVAAQRPRSYGARMDLALYTHPWDLLALYDHGGLARLRDLGIQEVALAVSYHAGRWLTPWHPSGMVRFLEDGTVHYRPKGNYGLLQPKLSSEVQPSGPSPLEQLAEAAAAVGLRVRAWAVLTHNTRLGELHPECTVENAFGDRYPYALCPANPHVQQYIVAMARDLAAHRGVHVTELEAFGWMGHRHNSHHDKNSFPADSYSDLLLSLCFCASCTTAIAGLRYEKTPVGAEAVARWRQAVAAALRRHFAAADCMEPDTQKLDRAGLLERLQQEFGAEFVTMIGHRIATNMQLAAQLSPLRRAGCELAVQTNYDALRGSAALPLAALGNHFDEVVLTTYSENPNGVAQALPHLLAARGEELVPPLPKEQQPRLRLCLHPKAPQYRTDDDLAAVRDLCAARGVSGITLYHFGLLPGRTLERAVAALRG